MEQKLLEKIASIEALNQAWDNLDKHNKLSHGLSGVTIEDFEKNKADKIASISSDLLAGKYSFSNNRAVLIPKSNGKFRPLQVPEIADRIVLKSIAIELEQQFSGVIEKSKGYSFAYQKKIGIEHAIQKITDYYQQGCIYALEADIINFFGTVNKEELLDKMIFPSLPDTTINNLISKALNQKLGGQEKYNKSQLIYFKGVEMGIPQGNPLSPLLSNIYLSPFDDYLIARNFKLVRYADDFVILGTTKEECEKAYTASSQALNQLKLDIHDIKEQKKTKIVDIKKDSLTFLSITFDGNDIYPSIENFERIKSKIRETCNGKVNYTIVSLLKKLINIQDGWISAFIYSKLDRYAEELDYFINRHLFLALRKYDWKLSEKSIGKLPYKHVDKKESRDCLSKTQRINSGIPYTKTLIDQKSKQNPESENIPSASIPNMSSAVKKRGK